MILPLVNFLVFVTFLILSCPVEFVWWLSCMSSVSYVLYVTAVMPFRVNICVFTRVLYSV